MPMQHYTITELMSTMHVAAGESENVALSGDVLDTPFDALGYDSLALLETAARIERELGIQLPDSTVVEAGTPRALLARINERIAAIAA